MKIATIIGTRPEIIRLSRVMAVLDKFTQHIIIHTGQNYDYELNQIFFKELNIRKPDFFLEAAGKTAAETISLVISGSDEVLRKTNPDALLVLGDTNSCLSAIAAKKQKIPIFHMEAGNRCFDQRVPEEINRKIIDHISDINLPYSSISRENLLREGLPADRIIKTGSPMFEVLNYYLPQIESSDVLKRMKLTRLDYFVFSSHREENIDCPEQFSKLVILLNNLAKKYGKRIIFSTHPRTKMRMEGDKVDLNPLVEIMKPFGFLDYVKLQINAKAVFSDSGTITEESSILNFPALNLRQSHERPEGMEEASVMMVGYNWERIIEALTVLNDQKRGEERSLKLVNDYTVDNVSEKVMRIILSYTDFVRRVVWQEK
ncbi:MAG: UDP-N-acetylglucosamine 2-epimerase (non-hydrolyzing) [bacterium]